MWLTTKRNLKNTANIILSKIFKNIYSAKGFKGWFLRISTHNHLTENYLNLFQNVLTKDFLSPHKSQGNGRYPWQYQWSYSSTFSQQYLFNFYFLSQISNNSIIFTLIWLIVTLNKWFKREIKKARTISFQKVCFVNNRIWNDHHFAYLDPEMFQDCIS